MLPLLDPTNRIGHLLMLYTTRSRLACATVKTIGKVYCMLRLVDIIEEIDYNDDITD